MEDENTVLLIDSWRDQASLDLHHKSPIMKKIMELRGKHDLHMKAERYQSEDELPQEDLKYIRK